MTAMHRLARRRRGRHRRADPRRLPLARRARGRLLRAGQRRVGRRPARARRARGRRADRLRAHRPRPQGPGDRARAGRRGRARATPSSPRSSGRCSADAAPPARSASRPPRPTSGPGFDMLAAALGAAHGARGRGDRATFAVETDLRDRARPAQPRACAASSACTPPTASPSGSRSRDPALRRPRARAPRRIVAGLVAADHLFELDADLLAHRDRARGPSRQRRRALLRRLRRLRRRRRRRASTRPTASRRVLVVPHEAGAHRRSRARRCPPRCRWPTPSSTSPTARCSMLGLARGDLDLVARGLRDRLHQPRRAHLYPRSMELVERRARARRARGDDLRRRPDGARLDAATSRPARSSRRCARGRRRLGAASCARRSRRRAPTCASSSAGVRPAAPSCAATRSRARRRARGAAAAPRRRAGSRRRGRAGGRRSRSRARRTRRRRSTGGRVCTSSLSPTCSCSDSNASRECTVRMSAMLSSTPSQLRSGLRLSRASSMTSSACSTPCSAKYCASAAEQRVVGGDERVDGQQAERRRAVDEDRRRSRRRRPSSALRSVSSRPILPAERQLGLGEAEVRRDDVVVDRVRPRSRAR